MYLTCAGLYRCLTDVAVEEPDAWIISLEAHNKVARRPDHERISAHRDRREGSVVARVICAPVIISSHDYLEIVAVKMERMLSSIRIVEYDLNNLILL